MSQSVLISTLVSFAKPRFSALPWPRIPMLATTTRSLAPTIRPAHGRARSGRRAAAAPPGQGRDPGHRGRGAGHELTAWVAVGRGGHGRGLLSKLFLPAGMSHGTPAPRGDRNPLAAPASPYGGIGRRPAARAITRHAWTTSFPSPTSAEVHAFLGPAFRSASTASGSRASSSASRIATCSSPPAVEIGAPISLLVFRPRPGRAAATHLARDGDGVEAGGGGGRPQLPLLADSRLPVELLRRQHRVRGGLLELAGPSPRHLPHRGRRRGASSSRRRAAASRPSWRSVITGEVDLEKGVVHARGPRCAPPSALAVGRRRPSGGHPPRRVRAPTPSACCTPSPAASPTPAAGSGSRTWRRAAAASATPSS